MPPTVPTVPSFGRRGLDIHRYICNASFGLPRARTIRRAPPAGNHTRRRRRTYEPVLKPQEGEADGRSPEVRVEDDPRVPRREVMRHDHLVDVAGGGPEEEAGGPDDRGGPQAEPSAEREKADGRKPQTRHPDFGLEGA